MWGDPKKIKELGDFLDENENKANYKKFKVILESARVALAKIYSEITDSKEFDMQKGWK